MNQRSFVITDYRKESMKMDEKDEVDNRYLRILNRLEIPTTGVDPSDLAFSLYWNTDREKAIEAMKRSGEIFKKRKKLIPKYSWAIPNEGSLNKIASFSPIIEFGSGGGYWAYLLRKKNVDITCFDDPSDTIYIPTKIWTPFSSIHDLKKEDLVNRTLFLCWPPMSPMAHYWASYHSWKYIIYIGEGPEGCCADEKFFNYLKKKFKQIGAMSIPRYWWVYDNLKIYERK